MHGVRSSSTRRKAWLGKASRARQAAARSGIAAPWPLRPGRTAAPSCPVREAVLQGHANKPAEPPALGRPQVSWTEAQQARTPRQEWLLWFPPWLTAKCSADKATFCFPLSRERPFILHQINYLLWTKLKWPVGKSRWEQRSCTPAYISAPCPAAGAAPSPILIRSTKQQERGLPAWALPAIFPSSPGSL